MTTGALLLIGASLSGPEFGMPLTGKPLNGPCDGCRCVLRRQLGRGAGARCKPCNDSSPTRFAAKTV